MTVYAVHKMYDYDDRSFVDTIFTTNELAEAYIAKHTASNHDGYFLDDEGQFAMWVVDYAVFSEL